MIVPSLTVRRGLVASAPVLIIVAYMAGGFAQWPWGANTPPTGRLRRHDCGRFSLGVTMSCPKRPANALVSAVRPQVGRLVVAFRGGMWRIRLRFGG